LGFELCLAFNFELGYIISVFSKRA